MNQPTLFDSLEPTPFERGMAGSEKAARKWTDDQVQQVDQAIRDCAKFCPEFTTDDVWARLPKEFPVTKGIGSRLNSFARKGLIRATDRTRISKRDNKHGHGQRLTIWQSL